MTAAAASFRAIGRVESRAEAIRRLAIAALFALGLGSIAVAGWSLAVGGIGWDTHGDTIAALITRSIPSSATLDQAYGAVPATSEFYGVLPQQLADVLHLLTTGSTTPLGSEDPTTYLYQGAANMLLAVLAVTALAVAIGLAFRSVLAGAFVWSLTLSMPLWLGMEHVDFKDMPVAAGLTLVTAGLVLAFVIERPRRATLIGVVVAGTGGAVAVASRPASIVLLAGLVGGTLVALLAWALVRHAARSTLPVVIAGLSVPVFGLALVWATNPIARLGTVQWLRDSIHIASKYPWDVGPIRTAGQDVRSVDLPWWYVPAWLGAQLPLLTTVALVGGVAVLVASLIRQRNSLSARTTFPLVPIVLQGVVLPVGIVVSGAVLYDGIRHLLFMIPALLALPAVALALLDRRATRVGSRLRVALPLGAVVVVAASLFASIRWAPYAYAFINPVAGWDKSTRSWELDYWGVSAREGVRRVREAGFDPVYVVPSQQPGVVFGASYGPLVRGGRAGLYVFNRWDSASSLGCTIIFRIKRDGQDLGDGAFCPNAASQ